MVTMRLTLGIDAGGTSTRAVLLDRSGACLGFGWAGGGNPTSAGIEGAASAIGTATAGAIGPRRPVDIGFSSVTIALAGEDTTLFHDAVNRRLGPLGFAAIDVQPDLVAMFHSGTPELDGYAVVSGTGAVAARISGGRLKRVADGNGWLLGDTGSGYWIGQRVVRAVVADLDGLGRSTAMSGLLLEALDIEVDSRLHLGRPLTLRNLISALYAMRPVQLSRFALIAFGLHEDAVAREILVDASSALADLLSSVRSAEGGGPIIAGGSVLVDGMLNAPPALAQFLTPVARGVDIVPVADGLVGAGVLALRAAGTVVDDAMFQRVTAQVERARNLPARDIPESSG